MSTSRRVPVSGPPAAGVKGNARLTSVSGILLARGQARGSGPSPDCAQGQFAIWVGVMTPHVLGHLKGGSVTAWRELRGPTDRAVARGRGLRFGLIALALVLGVAAATLLLPNASQWTTRTSAGHDR